MTTETRLKVQLGAQALTPLQRRLEEHGDVIEIAAGEVLDLNIVRTCFGFVLSGQLQLTWRDGSNENGIYPLHKGHWFGINNLVHQPGSKTPSDQNPVAGHPSKRNANHSQASL